MNTVVKFPRQHIAEQVSELNQIRYAVADLHGTAYSALRQIKAAQLPADMSALVLEAIEAIDALDKLASGHINSLLKQPT